MWFLPGRSPARSAGQGEWPYGIAEQTAAQRRVLTCSEVTEPGDQDQACNRVFLDTSSLLFPLYTLPMACDPGFQQTRVEMTQPEGREPPWGRLCCCSGIVHPHSAQCLPAQTCLQAFGISSREWACPSACPHRDCILVQSSILPIQGDNFI